MRVPELDSGQPRNPAPRSQALVRRRGADPLTDPVRPPYPPYEASADYVSADAPGLLVEYWNLIRRHKGVVLAIGLAGMLGALLITLPQTPIYQARTSLEIQGFNDNFLNMKSSDPNSALPDYSGETYIQTQIKILQSNALLGRVMTGLKSDDNAAASAAAPRRWTASLRSALHLPSAPAASPRLTALSNVARTLQVRNATNTHIVEILCDSADPQLAADFANTLVKEYIEHNLESRWKTSQHTGDWLKLQLQDLKIKLEQSERELQSYATGAGLQFTNEKSSVAEDKL